MINGVTWVYVFVLGIGIGFAEGVSPVWGAYYILFRLMIDIIFKKDLMGITSPYRLYLENLKNSDFETKNAWFKYSVQALLTDGILFIIGFGITRYLLN